MARRQQAAVEETPLRPPEEKNSKRQWLAASSDFLVVVRSWGLVADAKLSGSAYHEPSKEIMTVASRLESMI